MSNGDRELLALAAKAAGKARHEWDYDWLRDNRHEVARDMLWDPRRDSGQALELAVKLKIGVYPDSEDKDGVKGCFCTPSTFVPHHDDETVIVHATRRAIVRAAAAIGQAMQ